jgi:hypothetical protein
LLLLPRTEDPAALSIGTYSPYKLPLPRYKSNDLQQSRSLYKCRPFKRAWPQPARIKCDTAWGVD